MSSVLNKDCSRVVVVVCNRYFVNRTWPGPAWSPAQTLSSLLISIQSLMNEKPYHNEPGYERKVSKIPFALHFLLNYHEHRRGSPNNMTV